jgi:hypothetical protein
MPAPGAPTRRSLQLGKYLPWIVAVIVVIVVVSIIRLTSNNSPGLPPSTTTTTAGGVDSATKTAYVTASNQMDVANAAATRGLSGAASASVPQVTTVLTQYEKALQTFVFAVHGLQWTGSTQASSEQLTMVIQTMVTYLGTLPSVNSATLHGWLTVFHSDAANIQSADNTVRGQLGIPSTNSYP